MQKIIKINNQDITYTVKTSARTHKMRLAVYCDGSVVITKPRWLPNFMLQRFIKTKSSWILKKIDYFRKKGFKKIIKSAESKKIAYAKYLENKNQALILVKNKVTELNEFYNFKFNNISVKNQKSRWGSCSKKGNLNFNYRILFLPEDMQNYIIVHELCHLKEFNHSARFWLLVAQVIPDYLKIKKQIRKTELSIQ